MKKFLSIILILLSFVFAKAQNFEWVRTIGDNLYAYTYESALDASGNIYSAGLFEGTVDFDPGPGVYNLTGVSIQDYMYITKLDASGNFVWAVSFGGSSQNAPYSMVVKNGYVYLTGFFMGSGDFDPGAGSFILNSYQPSPGFFDNHDVFVLKLDLAGNFVWARSFSGAAHEYGTSMTVDATGNVYVTGMFNSTTDFDPGAGIYNVSANSNPDVFITKLDASGNFVWAKTLDRNEPSNWTDFIQIADNGLNIYLTGVFYGTVDFDPGQGGAIYNLTSAGDKDIFILKLDENGNFVWANKIGSSGSDLVNSITVDLSEDVFTTGSYTGTVDFDPGAGIFNLSGSGTFVSKIDAAGNFIWAKAINGTGTSSGWSLQVDDSDNVYTAGSFSGTFDFDPNMGIYNMTSVSPNYDIFISKLDSGGNFLWARSMFLNSGGFGDININTNNVFVTGSVTGTVDFDPGAGVYNHTAQGLYDAFVLKLTSSPITQIEEIFIETISLFPNPANDVIIINSEKEIGEIKIFDVAGRLIKYKVIKNTNAEIDIKELNAGIYFIKIENKRMKFVKR